MSMVSGVSVQVSGISGFQVSGVRCQRYYWTPTEYENEDE